jgi:hypothetical protein
VRAVAALLAADSKDVPQREYAAARAMLRARFADRITDLFGRDDPAYGICECGCHQGQPECGCPGDCLATVVRTPEEWCRLYGVDVRDPDGWRGKDDPPWEQPITLADFYRRAVRSTVRGATSVGWKRIARDAGLDARDGQGGDAHA